MSRPRSPARKSREGHRVQVISSLGAGTRSSVASADSWSMSPALGCSYLHLLARDPFKSGQPHRPSVQVEDLGVGDQRQRLAGGRQLAPHLRVQRPLAIEFGDRTVFILERRRLPPARSRPSSRRIPVVLDHDLPQPLDLGPFVAKDGARSLFTSACSRSTCYWFDDLDPQRLDLSAALASSRSDRRALDLGSDPALVEPSP